MSARRVVRWLPALSLMVLAATAWLLSATPEGALPTGQARSALSQREPARPLKPNIVFLLADDLDLNLGSIEFMPQLKSLLREQGTTLEEFFVNNSLCCPSRATFLRGQYVHNHRTYTNQPPAGGFEKFLADSLELSTVATWLQAAGYCTALLGKYLNGYPLPTDRTHIPPGWSEWYSPAAGSAYRQFNYTLNENGKLVEYGARPGDHMTDVLAARSVEIIERAARNREPFFLYIAPFAPHLPATPAPRHENLFPGLKAPRTASFNEPDVSSKPRRIRQRPLLDAAALARLDDEFRRRVLSLQAFDDLIARLVAALQRAAVLRNTYIVFTSDNGYHMGQHRLLSGKATAYEEDIRVPFIVRGPGIPAGEVRRGFLAGNVDLAPTFAEWAGVQPPVFVDGRSLSPLFRPAPPAPSSWRSAFLVEHYPGAPRADRAQARRAAKKALRRGGLLEPPDPGEEQSDSPQPAYVALRTLRFKYVEYPNGETELYDLQQDPAELHNLSLTADRALLQELRERLRELQSCAQAACREIEQRPFTRAQ